MRSKPGVHRKYLRQPKYAPYKKVTVKRTTFIVQRLGLPLEHRDPALNVSRPRDFPYSQGFLPQNLLVFGTRRNRRRHPHIVVVTHDLLGIGAARVCGCNFSAQRSAAQHRIKKRQATTIDGISGVGTVLAVLEIMRVTSGFCTGRSDRDQGKQ